MNKRRNRTKLRELSLPLKVTRWDKGGFGFVTLLSQEHIKRPGTEPMKITVLTHGSVCTSRRSSTPAKCVHAVVDRTSTQNRHATSEPISNLRVHGVSLAVLGEPLGYSSDMSR
eukprot:1126676-Amphidinium_carterae.1